MKASKKIVSAILSVCMVVCSMGMQVQAYDENGMQPELTEGEGKMEGELPEETGQNQVEDSQEDPGIGVTMEETEEQEQAKAPEPGVLNFIMQESDYIETPGMQNVAVSFGEEGKAVESAQLQYQNIGTGQEFAVEAVGIIDNMARFSMEYNSEGQTGTYELTSVTWTQDGKLYRAVLEEMDMKVVYGVNQEVLAEPDDVLLDKELLEAVEANVVTMDENGNAVSENTMEDILGQAGSEQGLVPRIMTRGAQNMVIVLDPGHDSTHTGASYYGYKEEDLVLKIAQYCKAELQKYSGVTIYMTRETQSCPNGGSSVDAGTCNARRVEFAAAKKANVYVSFHLNASASSTAKGVGVYYPNSNYNSAIGAEGKGLATEIYQKLVALGLSTWSTGILIRNSESNTQYPDGSLADYLAIIRRSKLAGFPAVLIEHAFLSNSGDVSNFLNSEAKLKKLGVADAQGIAAYYKLTLAGEGMSDGTGEVDETGGQPPVISSIQSRNSTKLRISWNEVPDAVSYEVYRSDSLDGDYSKIATVTGTMYDNGGVQTGTTYYYKVCTVYENGKMSGLSAAYSGKTLTKPEITSVVSKSNSQIQITWNEVADASKYLIYRSETEASGYVKIAAVKAGQTTYLDEGRKPQTTYYYKVRVRGGEKNGYSSYSNVSSGWAVKKTKIVSVSSKTKTSLVIKWNKVSNAYGYRIRRSTSKTKGYKTIATIKSGSTTSYVDKKLKTGKKYYYKIQVLNRVNKKTGVSGYSKVVSGATITGTSMVYARSKSSSSMEVGWNKDAKATGYRIKRSTSKNGTYQVVAEIDTNSTVKYTDKTITSGKKYYYVVESVVEKNGVKNYSGNSKPVTARNLKKVTIEYMETGEKGLTLNWLEVAGATGYQVMRSDSANGTFTEIATIGAESSYTDTQVTIGNRYYYKIRPISAGKKTGYGSYTKALEKWVLKAPQALAVVSLQPNQVKLSWEETPKAAGYEVFRSAGENGEYQSIATLVGSKNVTYTDDTILPGTVYYYKVSAIGENGGETGNGDETQPVSAQVGL